MAAPSATARQSPTGRRIPDGFVTKITFASKPALGIWEVKVKPPGTDGGEMINISTMHNTEYESFYPRTLKKTDDATIAAGVDPDALDDLDDLVNHPDTITVLYPDGTTEAYFGCLRKWEPTEFSIGEFPMVNLTISAMNVDASSSFAEQAPVMAEASGT